MFMLFHGWLQSINFDGSWPRDQPIDENYVPSQAEQERVRAIELSSPITKENVDDRTRCLSFNVCVRRFSRRPHAPTPTVTNPSLRTLEPPSTQPPVTGKRPLYQRACITSNGQTQCWEYNGQK
jgi:hypothetical protein